MYPHPHGVGWAQRESRGTPQHRRRARRKGHGSGLRAAGNILSQPGFFSLTHSLQACLRTCWGKAVLRTHTQADTQTHHPGTGQGPFFGRVSISCVTMATASLESHWWWPVPIHFPSLFLLFRFSVFCVFHFPSVIAAWIVFYSKEVCYK